MNWYRIRNRLEILQMYIRHIYRRVRYQWFCPNILVKVPNLKMYRYTDIDNIFNEVNFHLFCNFVERERDGIKGLEKDIAWMTEEITGGKPNGDPWWDGEKEMLQRQLDKDLQILEIYTYLQERKFQTKGYWYDLSFEEQEAVDEKETEILVKIVSMRRYLWT